jgi:hypothetical protein
MIDERNAAEAEIAMGVRGLRSMVVAGAVILAGTTFLTGRLTAPDQVSRPGVGGRQRLRVRRQRG